MNEILSSTSNPEDVKKVREVLLQECDFFKKNEGFIIFERTSNNLSIKSCYKQVEELLSSDLTQVENVINLDVVLERLNTIIAISILNDVENNTLVLKHLTRVPSMFFRLHLNKLKILKKLVLDGKKCHIIHISPEIGLLDQLKELDISGCLLDHLPDAIQNMSSLEILKLRHNLIHSLPKGIEFLTQLKELDVSHNHELRFLPRGIGKLINLQKLVLDHDDLHDLPEEIGNLSSLNEIRADHNHIKKLPESLQHLRQLKVLDVNNNELKELPKSIARISALEYVNITGNLIKKVPDELEKKLGS